MPKHAEEKITVRKWTHDGLGCRYYQNKIAEYRSITTNVANKDYKNAMTVEVYKCGYCGRTWEVCKYDEPR
jgi:hypothetical protein